ncbi:MAG: RNA polymerase sigma factor, partial [Bacteroidota bacterium]
MRKTVQEIRTAGQADQEAAVERLVAAYLRSGDRQTLGAILDACSGRVWSFALRHTSTRFDAEDLAQEILLAVCEDLVHLRDPEAFWPWFVSVERHVASRWYARRHREQELFFLEDVGRETGSASEGAVLLACLTPPCEEGLLDAELKQRLQSSVRALGRIYRDILVGFYVRGQNCSFLAAELGLPVGTVKRRLHEARAQLAQRLKNEEVEKPMRSNLGVPRRLYVYMNGSTGAGLPPWKYFQRLLPQNIALTAHERALTTAEVAELLGVARPYIEEEVECLVRAELMREVRRPGSGDPAYQTNFFILDEGTCTELESRLREAGRVVAPLLVQLMNEHGADIRGSAASYRYLDDERLYRVFGPLALCAAFSAWQVEPPPRRPDGGRWYMHGFADSHPWWICGTNIYGPEDEGKSSQLRYGTAIFWMTGQGAMPSPLSYRELQLATRI